LALAPNAHTPSGQRQLPAFFAVPPPQNTPAISSVRFPDSCESGSAPWWKRVPPELSASRVTFSGRDPRGTRGTSTYHSLRDGCVHRRRPVDEAITKLVARECG